MLRIIRTPQKSNGFGRVRTRELGVPVGPVDTAPYEVNSSVHPSVYLNIRTWSEQRRNSWLHQGVLYLFIYRTVLRCTRKRSFTYVPSSPGFRCDRFSRKFASALQHCVQISYTEFRPHRKINVESKDINLYTPEVKYEFHCARIFAKRITLQRIFVNCPCT